MGTTSYYTGYEWAHRDRPATWRVLLLAWLIGLPFSIITDACFDLPLWASALVGLASGLMGWVVALLVIIPRWRSRRSALKKLEWRSTPEVQALQTAAERLFLSQGQDPLRAEISAAELLDNARILAKGERIETKAH